MNELYYQEANHAVEMEKQRQYKVAEYAWKRAAEYANNPKNKAYALARVTLNNKLHSLDERYWLLKLEAQRLHAEKKEKKVIGGALQAHLCEENAS
ncbi:ANR family transcriptional regulator [Symbiopectobacterium purcellii]|uniref:ANR family transcriptional regulator n=1 Tax=Symbiopectobacterium purcellii TaxID=2871826 RepID=UPI003F844BB9